jgi:hypothetical protein
MIISETLPPTLCPAKTISSDKVDEMLDRATAARL